MLINVFGNWINPNTVTVVVECSKWAQSEYSTGTFIRFSSDAWVRYEEKTPDEVAAEINRQIKEQENE